MVGVVGRALWIGAAATFLHVAAAREASALDTLGGTLKDLKELPNAFAQVIMPSREALLDASPILSRRRRAKLARTGPRERCGSKLLHMMHGFAVLRPNAPDPAHDFSVKSSWKRHVEMEHFRDLFWCHLTDRLKETLKEIDRLDARPVPMPYRINIITYDYSQFSRWPEPFQKIRGIIADLAWLSLKGFAPAMVELAKLSARDDVIRLSPRFSYYLLASAERTGALDTAGERLLRIAQMHLTAAERDELDDRVRRREWPLKESMTLD